ncbi:hypothetical protein M408DRAFT_329199, partial [Serendipita vermifera MAFF 305830]
MGKGILEKLWSWAYVPSCPQRYLTSCASIGQPYQPGLVESSPRNSRELELFMAQLTGGHSPPA